ncbi:MAG: hypothetical protein WCC10_04520 [Tumebacillaceae bacterium]
MEPYQYQFVETHNRYLSAWKEALRTGNPGEVDAYTARHVRAEFGYAGVADPGLRELISAHRGAEHRCENRVIRPRNETEVVVFYERIMEREGKILAQYQLLQTWRQIEGEWRLIRELVEKL